MSDPAPVSYLVLRATVAVLVVAACAAIIGAVIVGDGGTQVYDGAHRLVLELKHAWQS
jgi:hypothetical protein